MSNDCKEMLKACYLDWVTYYRAHGSPRSDKAMKKAWDNWNRTESSRKLKKQVGKVCEK